MELRHLEHFVAVAEEGSFTRAARRVHIVQSGLSVSIRSLERELGAVLFDRTTARVALTDAGSALLEEARRTLAAAESARQSVAAVRGLVRGSVRLGTVQGLSSVDMADLLARFHAAHPGVSFRLRQASGGSAAHAESIRRGQLDLAFVSLPRPYPKDLRVEPLAAEPVLLACPRGHALAGRSRVRLATIRGEAFVDFPEGWGNRAAVDRAFAAAGVGRAIDMEVDDARTMIDLVRHGIGLGFAPRSIARHWPDLEYVAVTPEPVWETAIACAAGRPLGAAAERLLEMVLERAGAA